MLEVPLYADHDPTAVRRRLLRESAAHLGHGLMFGLGYLPSRHRTQRARDIHTLVFVHGLGGNRATFFPLQASLAWAGYNRQYAYNYRARGSIEALGVDLKRRLDAEVKGGRITLIGHSMGGLISRVYLQLLGGARRVDTLVTIATPHLGSHASAWLPTVFGSQLRPDGPFLRRLDAEPPPQGVRCVSFEAGEDLMVLPPKHALAPFGEHRVLPGRGHVDVLFSRELFRQIRTILDEQEALVAGG